VTTAPGEPAIAPGAERPAAVQGRVTFPCLEGIRALAAVMVVIHHASSLAGPAHTPELIRVPAEVMDAGVAIFFVISGFLLYRPFVRARLRGNALPGARGYFWRRVLRIYPAYWLALTVAVYVFGVGKIPDLRSFVEFYGLVHIYNSHDLLRAPIEQSWTLATEVSFYVVLPVWAYCMARVKGSPRKMLGTELAGVGILIAATLVWRIAVYASGTHADGMYNAWLPGWLDVFAFGMLIAILSVWTSELGRPVPLRLDRRFAPAACWIVALVLFWAISTQMGIPRNTATFTHAENFKLHYFYGVASLLFVLPAVFGPQDRGLIRGFLRTRVMVFLGVISYGVYLWHEMWLTKYIDWTRGHLFSMPLPPILTAVFALTVASAAISWYVFEKPILKLKDRSLRDVFSRRRTRAALARET
jgi:peptidoglycan/LPS O-acetylase OafA/YrhL